MYKLKIHFSCRLCNISVDDEYMQENDKKNILTLKRKLKIMQMVK